MHRSLICGAVAVAVAAGFAVPGTAGAHQATEPMRHLHARYAVIPYRGTMPRLAATGTSVPMFSHSVASGGKTFTYRQVGKDPFVKQTAPTSEVPVKVIPVKLVFADFGNKSFDPLSATCSPGGSPAALLAKSPLEQPRAYTVGGTAVGTDQYAGFARRAEYFTQVNAGGVNPGYHLNLAFTQAAERVITVHGGAMYASGCSAIGELSLSDFDNLVRTTIIPRTTGVTATTFPLILLTNVVLTDSTGACCVLGYHSAYSRNGQQTYGVGEFDTNGQFSGVADISVLSREIAEWMDDPLADNAAPRWAPVTQAGWCQSVLENGEPLSRTTVPVKMSGFTFHPQELAFSSWFYPGSRNPGVHGWYSTNGTLRTAAHAC